MAEQRREKRLKSLFGKRANNKEQVTGNKEKRDGGKVLKRKTPEERYLDKLRKQQRELEEFLAHELEWSDDLLLWYKARKQDMPDDVYRAYAFFQNREYLMKPGSLTLLYQTYLRCCEELPEPTKEIAFDLLAFRFQLYAKVLKTGGYDGKVDR